ncbi:MAG: iron ABC transporter permease [Bacteroidales bacterium]|nr:iron ABC transporter permease [Bacteroidales bacterium]MDY0215433.1 iron ABC transporter permease [Bacteroidales bacterium]
MTKRKYQIWFFALSLLAIALFFTNLALGSVVIPWRETFQILFNSENTNPIYEMIILKSRLPQSFTALFAGAALSVGGLIMQTYFRNPLADPSILGISAGASLGVAILYLIPGAVSFYGTTSGFYLQNISVITAALIGAAGVLFLIILFSGFVRNYIMLLVLGIMISAIAGSLIGILQVFASSEEVHGFAIWGLGSFSNVSFPQLKIFIPGVTAGLIYSFLLVKPMNMLLLGENQARNLGVNIRSIRIQILLTVGFLTALVTAYCGPVAFIGLAIPHMARLVFKTSNHAVLIPAVIIMGAILSLFTILIAKLPGFNGSLPVNAVTALFGAPVVIWIVLRRSNTDAS